MSDSLKRPDSSAALATTFAYTYKARYSRVLFSNNLPLPTPSAKSDRHSNTESLDETKRFNEVMSSLTSHFGTNYAPTDDELVEIRSLLAAPTARLSELEAEMARKVAEHDALHAQHTALSLELADYRALASPIRRLPVDLLLEIFLHCLPTDHNAILSHKEAPLLLTRVCSNWRAISFTTPVLWASMHVPVPLPLPENRFYISQLWTEQLKMETLNVVCKRVRAIEEWLARSGACKLRITVYDMERSGNGLNANYGMILDGIIPHSKRWRSMKFSTSADHLKRIAALTAEDVPALEEIDINMTSLHPRVVDTDSNVTFLRWAHSSILSAPRLHRVSFRNLKEDINTLPLCWQQLTHISLTGTVAGAMDASLSNITKLLMKCPELISAKLDIAYNGLPSFVSPHPDWYTGSRAPSSQPICTSPIVLSNLVELSLHNGGHDMSSFFAMLDVPRLTTLEYIADRTGQPMGEFIALLIRVSSTLISLTTDAQMYSREDFLAALKAAHRLKTLNIRGKPTRSYYAWMGDEDYVHHFDDNFLGMLVGRRLSSVGKVPEQLNCKGNLYAALLEEDWTRRHGEVVDDYSQILLPELENLDCHLPVGFTDEGILECLRLRQNPVQGAEGAGTSLLSDAPYTKLKRFSASFTRESTRPMSEDTAWFKKTGLALYLSYSPAESKDPFSPVEGIIDTETSLYAW